MDAYRALAEMHGRGDSGRYRKVLEFLMTPKPGGHKIVQELSGGL